jgi:broad specificity phosphatase PhoE
MVAQHPGETLALVMHGGSIRALLKYVHQQNGTIPHYEGHLGNTSVTILECPPAVSAWNVVTYNNMYHLETCEAELHLMSSPPDDSERPQEWNP